MLHVNPKMLAPLDELGTDLLDRRTRAEAENWAGEVEGIDMTLTYEPNARTTSAACERPTSRSSQNDTRETGSTVVSRLPRSHAFGSAIVIQ
ncbi:hypothetical protein [Actinokineospora bangkokensis]|nr:hypothetical protein [Actinokineospora bangkokensis]